MSDIKDIAIVAASAALGYYALRTAVRAVDNLLWTCPQNSGANQLLQGVHPAGEAAFSATLGIVGVGALIFASEKVGLTHVIEFQ